MTKGFFPRRPAVTPSIYAYEEPGNAELAGFLKIGFTNGDVRKRVAQQYPTARPGKPPYKIVLEESAMKNDGASFTDHDIHRLLRKRGFINPRTASHSKTEWFKCTANDVQAAIIAIRNTHRFAHWLPVSLSKNKFLTGPIQTNNRQKKIGKSRMVSNPAFQFESYVDTVVSQ